MARRKRKQVIGYVLAEKAAALQQESLARHCKELGAEFVPVDGRNVDALMDLTAEVILDSGALRRAPGRKR